MSGFSASKMMITLCLYKLLLTSMESLITLAHPAEIVNQDPKYFDMFQSLNECFSLMQGLFEGTLLHFKLADQCHLFFLVFIPFDGT